MTYKLVLIEKNHLALIYSEESLINLLMEHSIYKINDIYLDIHKPNTSTDIIVPVIEYVIRTNLPEQYLHDINEIFDTYRKQEFDKMFLEYLENKRMVEVERYLNLVKIQTTPPADYQGTLDPRSIAITPLKSKK